MSPNLCPPRSILSLHLQVQLIDFNCEYIFRAPLISTNAFTWSLRADKASTSSRSSTTGADRGPISTESSTRTTSSFSTTRTSSRSGTKPRGWGASGTTITRRGWRSHRSESPIWRLWSSTSEVRTGSNWFHEATLWAVLMGCDLSVHLFGKRRKPT